jgi:hypothetical protein
MIKVFKSSIYLVLVICLSFQGCTKDDGTILESNGLTKDINDLVPPSTLNTIESLGMYINTGDAPPLIENIYQITPNILLSSNLSGDTPGYKYADVKIRFYQQDNATLTVKIETKQGTGTSQLLDGHLVGSGSFFTVFAEYVTADSISLLRVYSGSIVSGGIEGWQDALNMLDNNNKPGVIANGTTRIFYDQDGFSTVISSMASDENSQSVFR